jgi:hypothetical protein
MEHQALQMWLVLTLATIHRLIALESQAVGVMTQALLGVVSLLYKVSAFVA